MAGTVRLFSHVEIDFTGDPMITLVFSRRRTIASFLIRAFTGSRWSHVGILTREGTVIDSTAKHGVTERILHAHLKGASAHAVVQFLQVDDAGVVAAARSKLGKSYDYAALVGIFFRARWEHKDKWFCSEFVAWAINTGNAPLFRFREIRGVTPHHLWMLAPYE